MKICDSHCHHGLDKFYRSFEYTRKIHSEKKYEDLKADWEKHEIEKCVLFPQPMPTTKIRHTADIITFYPGYLFYTINKHMKKPIDYSTANKEIYELSKRDERIIFVPFVNPLCNISDFDCFENIRGVKTYRVEKGMENLLEYLNENNLNLIIHPPEDDNKIEQLLDYAQKYDGVNFQIAHCGFGSSDIVGSLDELDNIYVDTSGCSSPLYVKYCLKDIPFDECVSNHPEKVLFGSDVPWTEYDNKIEQIKKLELGINDQNWIFSETFKKLWVKKI